MLPATETPVNHLYPDREWYTTDVFTDYALHFMDECFEDYPDKPPFPVCRTQRPAFPPACPRERYQKVPGRFKEVGWGKLRQAALRADGEDGADRQEVGLVPIGRSQLGNLRREDARRAGPQDVSVFRDD